MSKKNSKKRKTSSVNNRQKNRENTDLPKAVEKMNEAKRSNSSSTSKVQNNSYKTKDKKKTPKQIREEARKKSQKNTVSKNKKDDVSVVVQKYNSNVKAKPKTSNKKTNKKQDKKQNKKEEKRNLRKEKAREKKKLKRAKKEKTKGKIIFKKVFFTLLFIIILLGLIAGGVIGGAIYGIIDEETNINPDDLQIKISNSKIVTSDGLVELAELSGDEKRKIISIDEMSPYLPKAYVAIEDERFYQHKGVDVKRTASAIVYSLMGKSSYGGSTITQQLVKNLYDDKEKTYIRKIREWFRAYKVEKLVDDKEKILEQYLNILFVGGQMHGVELGAEYYFAKTAKELDLAESAFLAGINHMPNAYNPYDTTLDNAELIKKRTLTVLDKMYELGYITAEEKQVADDKVNAGLVFQKMESPTNIYSYHTDAIIDQLTKQLMEERNWTKDQAETFIYGSGLTIYSTVDQDVQAKLEAEFAKTNLKLPGKLTDSTQAAMVVIDYKTGNVVGCVGSLGDQKTSRGLNRATQTTRQLGSAMKPIATIAPALEEKIIQVSTVYDDSATEFTKYTTPWRPENYNRFKGYQSIRQFIETSQNIPAAKIMTELSPSLSLEYLEKLGITTLNPEEDAVMSLALGGQHNGVSPLDVAVAYGTIANGGLRISPTFYTKVLDANGVEILTPNQEKVQAISPENAYITQQILREPVYGSAGTATYCAIPGIETGAKTGTTDDNYDRWLCGITPYYSAACWFGYDVNEKITYNGTNPAGQLWSNAMKAIHKDLANASFERPAGIIERAVCTTTGQLAGKGCPTKMEIFTEDNLPTTCQGHGTQTICSDSHLIATPYCTSTYTRIYGAVLPKESLGLWKPLTASASGQKITATCNLHTYQAPVTPSVTTTPNTTTPSTNTTTPSTNTNTNTTTTTPPTTPSENTTTTTPSTDTTTSGN